MNLRRLSAALLSAAMLTTMVPLQAFAAEDAIPADEPAAAYEAAEDTPDIAPDDPPAEPAEIYSGSCGENVSWTLDSTTGELSITGTGPMRDYSDSVFVPWNSERASVETVTIGSGVTSIGAYAFLGCQRLKSVTIPSSVTNFGGYAFYDCISLASVIFVPSGAGTGEYGVPSGGEHSIGYHAFSGCTSLKSFTIPKSITSIDGHAFAFSALESVTIPDGMTHIGVNAFEGCGWLADVKIPDSVVSIGQYAFSQCGRLKSIHIPNSVTSIGNAAFRYTGLESVTLPTGITSIGDMTFTGCDSLETVTIPRNVTSIGHDAFSKCTVLESITIPKSVTSISWMAFYGCDNLQDIYYTGTQEQWNRIQISNNKNDSLFRASLYFIQLPPVPGVTFTEPVYDDSIVIRVTDPDGRAIPGVAVACGENAGTTGLNGEAVVKKELNFGLLRITAEKEGYYPYQTLENEDVLGSGKQFTVVLYSQAGESGAKLQSALYSNLSDMSMATNVLTGTKTVGLQMEGGPWNLIWDMDFGKFFLSCKTVEPDAAQNYELWQNGRKIAQSSSGYFVLKNTMFTKGSGCEVRVLSKNGFYVTTPINLAFARTEKNPSAKVGLSDGAFVIAVPDKVPFLGGSDVNLSLPKGFPVEFYVAGDKVHIGFNCTVYDSSSPDPLHNQESFAHWWGDIKNKIDAASSLRALSGSRSSANLLKDLVQQKGSPFELPGGKFTGSVIGYAEGRLGTNIKGKLYIKIEAISPKLGFNTVVVVVPVTVQFQGRLTAETGLEISYDWDKAEFLFGGTLDFDVAVEAFGGFGAGDVVGVGAYGSASVLTGLQLFGGKDGTGLRKVDLTGQLGIKAYLAALTYKKAFGYNTWHLYTANSPAAASLAESAGGNDYGIYDASLYEPEDLSYLAGESGWLGHAAVLADAEAHTAFRSLLEGTYQNAQPTMISAGGSAYAAFTRADWRSGNIYLAVTKFDGTDWEEPVAVSASPACDSSPVLCEGADGTIWLAYAKTAPGYDDTSLFSFARSQSIVVGSIDPDTLAFTPCREYTGSGYLRLPDLAVINGTPTLMWVDSAVIDDDSVLSPASGTIRTAVCTGGTWEEDTAIAAVNDVIDSFSAGSPAAFVTRGHTLYTVSASGAVAQAAEDVTGRLSRGILPNGIAEEPLWNGENTLNSLTASVEAPGITGEYAVCGDKVYYSAATGGSANLFAVQYAADGSRSEAIRLTDHDRYLEDLSVVTCGGRDIVLGMDTWADIYEDDVELDKNLVWSEVMPVCDLRLDDLTCLDAGAAAGEEIPVAVTVTNAGDHAISGYAVMLDGVSVAAGSALQPGESEELSFTVAMPGEQADYTVSVALEDEDDYTPGDNTALFSLGCPDLSVTLSYERIGLSRDLVAEVSNVGVTPASGTVIFTDDTGTQWGESDLPVLAPGETIIVRYELPEDFAGRDGGSAGVSILCDGEEVYTGDNTDIVYLFDDPAPTALSITTQPQSVAAAVGETAKFTVTATGDTLTYQWQYRSPAGTKWANTTLSGNKTATLSVPATAGRDGYSYRCRVTDGAGTAVYSDAAVLTVKTALVITGQPQSVKASAGETAKFTVAAAGDGITFQWQYKSPTGTKWANTTLAGNRTAALSVSVVAGRDGYSYRCKVTDSAGAVVYSDAAVLAVRAALSITAQPQSIAAYAGITVKFSAAAAGEDLVYQWQYKSPAGTKWANTTLAGNRTAALSVPVVAGRDGYSYRCRVTDSTGAVVYSDAAVLTVRPGPAIIAQPQSVTVSAGETAKFTVAAAGNGLTYQWQYKSPTGTKWANTTLAGNKTAALSVPATAGRDGYSYRCRVTDSAGTVVYSDAAVLTVR